MRARTSLSPPWRRPWLVYDSLMGRPVFSVIVPASGRDTLMQTLKSIRRADRGDIEVLVIGDGDQPVSEGIVGQFGWGAARYIAGPQTRQWGQTQRMLGMVEARGDYLMFMDDDDVYRRRAFTHVRRAVAADPGRVILFRMRRYDAVFWQRPVIERGQVATPQFVVPNMPGNLGSWLTGREASDYSFIRETVGLLGEPVWNRKVICVVRPLQLRRPMPWIRIRCHHGRTKIAEKMGRTTKAAV